MDGTTVNENPENARPGWRIQSFDGEPADWPEIEELGAHHSLPDFPGTSFVPARIVGAEEPHELVVGQPINFWVPSPAAQR